MFLKNIKKSTDEGLMQLIANGKSNAFDELYLRYGKRMYNYFLRMLRQDTEKAMDFTQDLFLKIIEKPKAFDPSRKFKTWIYTVASNMCKNEYRRHQNHNTHLGIEEQQFNYDANYIFDEIDQAIFNEALSKAIDGIGGLHQECFVLRYQEDLSVREIAEVLDCPEGTVKSRLFYTLKKLSEQLYIFHPSFEKHKKNENKRS